MALRKRVCVLPIDDILRAFGDYLGTDAVPVDSIPVTLATHPKHQGMLGLVIESKHFKKAGEVRVDFEIKRVHTV